MGILENKNIIISISTKGTFIKENASLVKVETINNYINDIKNIMENYKEDKKYTVNVQLYSEDINYQKRRTDFSVSPFFDGEKGWESMNKV